VGVRVSELKMGTGATPYEKNLTQDPFACGGAETRGDGKGRSRRRGVSIHARPGEEGFETVGGRDTQPN